MVTGSYDDTIQAASSRARECRARLEQLRNGGPYGEEHVRHAREQLDNARRRAALALERADAQSRLSDRAVVAQPVITDRPGSVRGPGPDVRSFAARLRRLDWSITDFWVGYTALDGRCSLLEVDAAVHGALVLTELDVMRLDQALWEGENFR